MTRRLGAALYVALLLALVAAWVRNAWLMPLRNYAFDFQINYTGSRLIEPFGPDRPLYDRLTLWLEAQPYTTFPTLYTKLYLTYIQTPITAVVTLPFSRLPWEVARASFLTVSNVLLVAAAALMVMALRPSRLLILAAFLIFGTYEAMFDSLRLGQVDAIIVFCLALAFTLQRRGPRPLAGAPLALAAILKLSPGIVIGWLLWQRQWRVVAAAAMSLALLLTVSVAIAGWDNHVTFMRDISPKLAKGSAFYDNISIAGAVGRAHFRDELRAVSGQESWFYEDELPDWPAALRLALLALDAAIVVAAFAVARRNEELGFMLAIAVALLISPVTWSFYPTWLIPCLLWLVRRYEDRRAWRSLAALATLYPMIAIVPAHYQDVFGAGFYAVPFKTAVLTAFCVLLALEARLGSPVSIRRFGAGRPRPAAAAPALSGGTSPRQGR